MFTGIIQSIGEVESLQNGSLRVKYPSEFAAEFDLGESIAIDGVCLTVVEWSDSQLKFDLSPETIQKTTFSSAFPGKRVHLERALRIGDSLGGHFVQGHVDGVGTITDITQQDNSTVIRFKVSNSEFLFEKGSIAINGTSLTIVDLIDSEFYVWMIPHTIEKTTFGERKVGDQVNIEYDMLAKHLVQLTNRSGILQK